MMGRKFLLILIVIFLGIPASIGQAAKVNASNSRLDIQVSQGLLIDLDKEANTVFVAEPEIASYQVVNPSKILVFGRLPGQTTLVALDDQGEPIYNCVVSVRYNTTPMSEALKREFPSLNLKLTSAADGVAVSGLVPSAQIAADVISLLDSFVQLGAPSASSLNQNSQGGASGAGESGSSGAATGSGTLASRYGRIINRLTINVPTQVNIRVRVAEVNRNLSDQLGIKWFYTRTGTKGGHNFVFGVQDGNPVAGMMTATTFSGLPDGFTPDFGALIDALAQESMVSVLAEPNLTVMSGDTASFLAGGQIPFPVAQQEGQMSVEFKDFGVLLAVTPTVLSQDRVSLRIRPEVSEPSWAYGIRNSQMEVPGFVVRRAETTIELASGQSFVIGGLLQSNLQQAVDKIPFLGDLPIIGLLARSQAFQRGETELVIIATAYLSQPSGETTLMIPNANVVIPGFLERFFLGSKPKVKPGPLAPSNYLYY
ncbi:MAG: type II and III secretion system protein family protein [Deltaproteobacteria bacterium]|nr:type II and III secretion system protein family protein [Deltaproteobacteria bacterium]